MLKNKMPVAQYIDIIHDHIDIIRDRVTNIRSALFFNMGEFPSLYSARIISALEVDDEGYIFFFIAQPEYFMIEEKKFPVRLEFYRKGKPYFLKLNGMAELASSEKSEKFFNAYGLIKEAGDKKLILLKVKIELVEYNELHQGEKLHPFRKWTSNLAGWFS